MRKCLTESVLVSSVILLETRALCFLCCLVFRYHRIYKMNIEIITSFFCSW